MLIVVTLVAILVAVLVIRTLKTKPAVRQVESSGVSQISDEAANKLAESIRIKTVSHTDASLDDYPEFERMEAFLKEQFPLVHQNLTLERLSDYALLYTWQGSDKNLKPVMLTAHYDVVPASDEGWEHPPFGGEIIDGQIWGRGSLDYKIGVIAMLEAAEQLLKDGFQPERTILFSFGGDEEVNGPKGAMQAAAILKQRGVELEFILDEGAVIVDGMLPDIKQPLALIGIAEKGHINVELRAKSTGGHASMPPNHTAAGVIARACNRLEEAQFPAKLTPPVRFFMESLAPHCGFGKRLLFSNLWLFGPLVKRAFLAQPNTAAMMRTTLALTMLDASDKENVLPDRSYALFNMRILPGETIEGTLDYLKKVIDDPSVEISLQESWVNTRPVESSSIEGSGFKSIADSVNEHFPEAIVTPYLVTASTDSKHFAELTDNIYRILPLVLTNEDLSGVHAVNEKVSVEAFKKATRFYMSVIKRGA